MLQDLSFTKMEDVDVVSAIPSSVYYEYVKQNIKKPFKRVHHMVSWQKPKGNIPIALIGGGPSIGRLEIMEELKSFDGPIVACGSSHDFLREHNITPTYCVVCDPDPVAALYITNPSPKTIYLIATQCHENVFANLKMNAIYMWHSYNEDFNGMDAIEPGFEAVGGGCTIGLRSLSMVIMMGYNNIHFYNCIII